MPRAVRLKRPLERAILSGHPWIYRDALAPFDVAVGEAVDVFDKRGRMLARGLVEQGAIGVRVFTTQPGEAIGPDLLRSRVETASALRQQALPAETDAYRLIHGEGDRLPGLVCDRYGRFAVVKLDGEAALARSEDFRQALGEPLARLGVTGALLRGSRKQAAGVRAWFGEQPPAELEVRERGMRLLVNLWEGQKTGLFLDHRESRARVRGLSRGLRVLNLYGYTGGFSLAAALGGARAVTTVDVAAPALALAERTFAQNGLPASMHSTVCEDVPAFLSRIRASAARYDLIICDPPNFAPSENAVPRALESYAQLHAACLDLLVPGGLYLTASCSSHVRLPAFVDSLRAGASRSRRIISVLESHGAPFDHPRLLAFPEGDYLKVLLCRS